MKKSLLYGLVAGFLCTMFQLSGVSAETKHIQLSLIDKVQLYSSQTPIHGLRLSIYGVNEEVQGADLGIVPRVTGDFKGYQWGAISIVEGATTGYQGGLLSYTKGNLTGVQGGFVSICGGDLLGVQGATVNFAGSVSGVQFGLLNYTEKLYGFQVGVININKSGKPVEYPFLVLPIVNLAF